MIKNTLANPPIELSTEAKEREITQLALRITERRYQLMQSVLKKRTRFLTLVLEDVYQPHNAAAVVRSCEAFGIQDLYVIENRNHFKPGKSSVARGADKWVDVHYQHNTTASLQALKQQGYQIAACTLRAPSTPINELKLEKPLAILIGTELKGLTEEAHAEADMHVSLPMHGFTQSLNLSVCSALFLYELTKQLRAKPETLWQLTKTEQEDLLMQWLLNEHTP